MTEPASDEIDPLIGTLLANRYQIVGWLGEGAMGAVYKAKHIKLGRSFAVKLLHRRLLEDRKVMQRFEREAELAGRLHHRNVIGVVDIGETPDGSRYMVMDLVHGADLATLLSEAPMPAARIIHLTRQLLEGLYHAHEQGLIHRDFKPENVIIELDDHGTEVPRIVDFGIAILRDGGDGNTPERLTTNGLVLGTPHYMAPEQALGDPLDHRVDLFALGIVIYELLCGRLPFDGTGVEIARANTMLDPPTIAQRVPYLEVDPLLEAFARRLMSKARDARPATAKVARELLDQIARDRHGAATELGLAAGSISREPALTMPVAPRVAGSLDLEAPPLVASIAATPVAPVDEVPPSAPGELPEWNQRSTRRGMWIGGAIVIAIVATIGVALALTSEPRADRPTVSSATPQPTPTPRAPAVRPEPPKPRAPDVAIPSATLDTPPKSTHQVPADKPRKPAPVIAFEPTKPEPPQIVPKVEPRAEPKIEPKTEPKTEPKIDAATLRALYIAVGQDFKAAAQARGAAAVANLEATFRRIQIQDAIADEQKREATAATLHRLRAELAPLKQPP